MGGNPSIYLSLEQPSTIPIKGYDIFVQTDIYVTGGNQVEKICDIKKDGKNYTLLKDIQPDQVILRLIGENGRELISFNTQEIYDRFFNDPSIKEQISIKEATFAKENSLAKMAIVVQNASLEKANKQFSNSLLDIFVQIK